tara:strand:+ start:871 stop:1638 length:768 start_codon:yes stop_codon:yes gene_type:complete
MNELVSIIIPFYKKKKYFKRCINSVLNQTYKKIEVIVIYDDENKKDLKYIKTITKKEKRLNCFVNKKNYGAGVSRNIGIKKSRGKYLAFIDSDDYWKKNKIRIQLDYMKKKKLDFTHTNYFIINDENKNLGLMRVKNFLSYNDLMKSCDIGLSTVMISRKVMLKNSFTNLRTKEDYSLWLKLSKKKVNIIGINKNLTFWQKSKNSLSSSLLQKMCDAFRVYNTFEKKNIFLSLFYVLRLSSYFLFKKFDQKKNIY